MTSKCNVIHFHNSATVTLGARGDSYYEYLLKQWLQTGKKNDQYVDSKVLLSLTKAGLCIHCGIISFVVLSIVGDSVIG